MNGPASKVRHGVHPAVGVVVLITLLLAESNAWAAGKITFQTQPPTGGLEVVQNGHVLGQTDSQGIYILENVTRGGSQSFDLRRPDGHLIDSEVVDIQPELSNKVRFNASGRQESPAPPEGAGSLGSVLLPVLIVLFLIVVAVLVVVLFKVFFPSPAPTLQTATPITGPLQVDRYSLGFILGRGGMATVYIAHDSTDGTQRELALKVMHEDLLNDPDLVRKFLREGESLQRIEQSDADAPVPRVYRYGQTEDSRRLPFLAMELLSGENALQRLRRQGRFSSDEAVLTVSGVARALIPAHAMGVYHRDLTPDNVIFVDEPRGGYRLRLIDFGVARHEYTAHNTLDGSITGKPPYMSPEQCRGLPVDGRSDIYALGIMLYAFLAGKPPFTSTNPLDVMRMHTETAVMLPAGLNPPLRALLERALAKDPEARFPDIRDFYDHLLRIGVGNASG